MVRSRLVGTSFDHHELSMTGAVIVILRSRQVGMDEASMGWGVKDELTTSPDASFDHHELSMTGAVIVILRSRQVGMDEASMGWGVKDELTTPRILHNK